ncbi:UNVERIFIED_CONTAM: hypothetical protein RMT77_002569 [Armadillidium vulgare]
MAEGGWLYGLATLIGASEPALKLLISLLIGYPLLYIHRKFLHDKSPILQHFYFILGGVGIAIFNNGINVLHSMFCIFFAWLVLFLIGGTLLSVLVSFTFQMGYLLIAYYVTGTDTYDIKWTMPHCVLTLRLIALAFDLYDGSSKTEDLSKDQQATALKMRPSLLEIAGHTYFPASFMVGPQFSMKRYLSFVHGTLYPVNTPSPVFAGLKRGFYGVLYLLIYQIGISIIPDSFLLSEPYMTMPFWKRFTMVGIWGKITLYKYVSCWLITEGACILSGLAYSGKDEDGNPIWKGCANVKLFVFELSTQFGMIIQGFNTNTNAWLAQYIYKRLKFLNNRYLSQVGALLFLALWHGFHSGYYACFFMEFIIMFMERRLAMVLRKFPKLVSALESPPLSYILFVVMKFYTITFMGYCLGSFVLLKSSKWLEFYSSLYYIGHIFFGCWIFIEPLVKLILSVLFGRQQDSPKSQNSVGNPSESRKLDSGNENKKAV